jgi:hypothetical protein
MTLSRTATKKSRRGVLEVIEATEDSGEAEEEATRMGGSPTI